MDVLKTTTFLLLTSISGATLGLNCQMAQAAEFAIAKEQSLKIADETTHEIRSGDVVLGISEYGGGYINKLYIPGVGDLLGQHASRYGRGGQVTIRDRLHHGKYNPTQAGFTDWAGTFCRIEQPSKGVLHLPPRPLALWNGDGKYDFTEWENLAVDPYKRDLGHSDEDGLDESQLADRQAAEITSEFDFTGSYEDVRDGQNVVIPAFRFSYEFRFVREPGHALSQFRPGTPAYNAAAQAADRTNHAPRGRHPSAEDSLTDVILSTTLRGDKAIWDPRVVFLVDKRGNLASELPSKSDGHVYYQGSRFVGYPLIIYSTHDNPDKSPAVGFFHPNSHVNKFSILGRSIRDNSIQYEDARTTSGVLLEDILRTRDMWRFGVRTEHTGLLSRKETPQGIYEAIRGESYILVGTPNEIVAAARAIERGQQASSNGGKYARRKDRF